MRNAGFCIAIGLILAMSATAGATTTSFTVYPGDLGTRDSWFTGSNFGFDHEDAPNVEAYRPLGSSAVGGAPGYGDSSFLFGANGSVSGVHPYYGSLRLSPENIFGKTVTVGDLAGLSFYTNWESGLNYQVRVYTYPNAAEQAAGAWYGDRFNSERAPAVTGWNQAGIDNLDISWILNKATGASTHPNSLWPDASVGYETSNIMWIDLGIGYLTSSPPGASYLDGVQLTLSNGDVADVNLQAVPEPITMAGVFMGIAGLAGYIRKRRMA